MNPPKAPPTQLHGPRLTLARAAWFALVILALAVYAADRPVRIDELRVPCAEAEEECPLLALSPQEVDVLREAGLSLEFYAGFHVGAEIFSMVMHTMLAGLIFWRRSADRVGLFISFALVMNGIFFSSSGQALVKLYPGLTMPINLSWAFATIAFVMLFYLFPDGRFVPRWTRLLAVVVVAAVLSAAFLTGGPLFYTPDPWSDMMYFLIFGGAGAGLFAQVYRYRRVSGPAQRQQTKWVVFGLGAVVLVLFTWTLGFELYPPPPGPIRLYLVLFGVGVLFPVILLFPLSISIAILRYRLWDIDVLINRTLVYFGGVVLLQGLFRALTGQESQLAVVASTLAIAALFGPLRRRVQGFIDRRFYRRKYDAARTLAAFAATARDEVELEQLTGALLGVMQETMQPAFVSLWLAEIPREASPWGGTGRESGNKR